MRERDIPMVEISLAVRFLRQRNWLSPEVLDAILTSLSEKCGLQGFLEEIRNRSDLGSDQLQSLERRIRNQMVRIHAETPESRIEDGKFGRIAIEFAWISVDELESSLLEQSRLRRIGLRFRLGEVLFRMGYLTQKQVESVLEKQGQRVKTCEECGCVAQFSAHFCSCGHLLRPGPVLCPVAGESALI